MGTIERVEHVAAPVVTASGLELIDVEVQSGAVRIIVDRPGGVDLDTIGSLASVVSRALDEADAVPGGRYELEVSSPGLERRLRRPEHFQSHIGAEVSIKTKQGVAGERRIEGVIASADDNGLRVEGEALPGGARELRYDDVDRAHTIFDWRAALAGTSSPSSRREHKAARQQKARRETHGRYDDSHETETR
ncbi:MAG: ribosome maturation factor RimP [Acidimicrobiales bacterium]